MNNSSNNYLLRSMMFVPGHNQLLLDKASRSEADALILDLEDSVQPFNNKSIARDTIYSFVKKGMFNNHLIFPRVNDRESGLLLKDIYELTIPGIEGFVYPKSTCAEDIYFFDKLLETIEYEKGVKIGTFKIVVLMETTAAILNAEKIAKSSRRIIALAFGCEDYITDLQGIHDKEGISILGPRVIIANAARSAGIIPVDTVHINVHDMEDLEKNLILSKKLGFEGMLILSPRELSLAHKYYSPTAEDIQEAQTMLDLAEKAKIDGKGVAVMNGKFVGPPMISTAKKILHRTRMISKKNSKI